MLDLEGPDWSIPQVKAFSTQRTGGVSQSPYDSFNLGDHVEDSHSHVQQNRAIIQSETAMPSEPVWLKQEHTNKVFVYDADSNLEHLAETAYDAIYTNQPNVVCTVMTADCMPLLVSNLAGTEVAAIHAGWRGMASDIIENTLNLFKSPLSECVVWAGPTISQQHFEVGREVQEQLGGSEQHYLAHTKDSQKCYADLYALAGERVSALGANYSSTNDCTYRDADKYFSFRRDGVTGRMASVIWFSDFTR